MSAGIYMNNGVLAYSMNLEKKLKRRKHYYFIPFGQDDPQNKPTSMVADFSQLMPALEAALEGRQLQPILL